MFEITFFFFFLIFVLILKWLLTELGSAELKASQI